MQIGGHGLAQFFAQRLQFVGNPANGHVLVFLPAGGFKLAREIVQRFPCGGLTAGRRFGHRARDVCGSFGPDRLGCRPREMCALFGRNLALVIFDGAIEASLQLFERAADLFERRAGSALPARIEAVEV